MSDHTAPSAGAAAGTATGTTEPDLVNLLARLGEPVAALVDSVDDTTRGAPTPCADMDVQGLVEHLVGGLEQFAAVAEGAEGIGHSPAPVREGRGFRDALAHAVDSWAVPGRLERSYAMPWGPSTGRMLVGFLVVEQAGHGWDLATALGRRLDVDEADVAAADAVVRGIVTPEVRVPGMFGPEVAPDPDAPALDRLAAFLGRCPSGM